MQTSLLVKLPYRVCIYFVVFGENNQEERSVLCNHGEMANSGQLTLDIACLLDFFHRIFKKHSETGTMHDVKCWASQRILVSILT